mmetsp:Transcript_24626/g.27299  ORF Transcript_24626/g.27299 Transcript_24626/m.27299 type:complete len:300 (-) Transcript_24626:1039-1938(-)
MYNHRSHILDGPSHSMGRKLKPLMNFNTPGPGQYNIEKRRPKSQKSRMSKSARDAPFFTTVPGPGQYNLTGDSGKSVTFTKSKRNETSETTAPGPGSYHIPTWNDDTGRSILERHDEKLLENFPGPGMYDIKLGPGLSYSISGHETLDYTLKERMSNPAPTEYQPNSEILHERTKGGAIGKGNRSIIEEDQNPGPGHYTFYDINGRPKGCVMGEKYDLIQNPKYPGPGHYDQEMKSKGASYSVGKSQRQSLEQGDNPGPGSYTTQLKNDKGQTMSKGTKIIKYSNEDIPGPGHYDPNCK